MILFSKHLKVGKDKRMKTVLIIQKGMSRYHWHAVEKLWMKQFSVCFTQILREINEFWEKEKGCVEGNGEMNNVQIISYCLSHDGTTHDDVNEQIHLI